MNSDSEGHRGKKSQYHYTAKLKKDGKFFCLHIYYNEHDGCIEVPFLAQVDKKGKRLADVDCEEYHETFQLFAHRSIKNLVAQIRKDQKELVAKLKEEYEVLEKEATRCLKIWKKIKNLIKLMWVYK